MVRLTFPQFSKPLSALGVPAKLPIVLPLSFWNDATIEFQNVTKFQAKSSYYKDDLHYAQTPHRRRPPPGRSTPAQEALETLGTLSFRPAVGNCARRLQRKWHGLGKFSI